MWKRVLVGSVVFLSVVGCGQGSGGQMSFSTRVGSSVPVVQQGLTQALTSGDLAVDRIRIVVRQLQLENHAGDVDSGLQEVELETGPFLLDLSGDALSGAVTHQFDAQVPAGTYDEVSFDIHKLSDGEPVTDPALTALQEQNASIIIDGSFQGALFSFASEVDENQEHRGTFEVSASSQNITLNIDPTHWLDDGAGGTLDPRDPNHRSDIEANIKSSIKPFDDDDHDGQEDEHQAEPTADGGQ